MEGVGEAASATTGAAPIVRLRGVDKVFPNGVRALAGFDLVVRRGEFLALLGPSGCGKSTALRLIAGLAQPNRGAIEWADAGGGAPGGAPGGGGRRAIGFVFQEPTLMPWATVQANVALPLRLKGLPHADASRRVAVLLDRVGLADFAHAYPHELSGGMRMRASIARALATDPDILLMDEPFAALDEIARFKLNNDLADLWRGLGKTIVFVTHSTFESAYLAERIVVMTPRPGRVFAELPVAAGYPRGERFRTSAEYAACCRTVADALAAAMAGGEAAPHATRDGS